MVRKLIILTILMLPMLSFAQETLPGWYVEAEDEDSKVTVLADGTIDIIAPKGLTLWHSEQLAGNVIIDYDARIVVDSLCQEPWNRLSDLNCFWMATDPDADGGNVLLGAPQRNGVFLNQYALKMYYVGYGGNHNKTTRFRRYDGDKRGITVAEHRPAILREYTDQLHLLKENKWYHVRLEQVNGWVSCVIDDEVLVDYLDSAPYTQGYFGFRTTKAHAQLKNLKINQR